MIQKLADAKLPTVHGTFNMVAYDSGVEGYPHLALVHCDLPSDKIIDVRIHSECMTGDVFGSVRCDCGEQLDTSLSHFGTQGGVLIYLRQEGRGIGLVNKMHAYNLQDEGLDTVKANQALGFHSDSRDYSVAIEILDDLGISRINLLTNNPEKVEAFAEGSIEVVKRLPIEIQARAENEGYLRTKVMSMGHLIKGLNL
jgi:GTP cyclohydrolase II